MLKSIDLSDGISLPKKRLKVAITGLSKSGKSVFITSLINQLLNEPTLLKNRIDREFLVKLKEPKSLKKFPYIDYLEKLKAKQWPESTSDISSAILSFEIESKSSIFKNRFLDIEVVDYPGEWLLDIEMLNLNFKEWSKLNLELIKKYKIRESISSEYLNLLKKIDITKPLSNSSQMELFKSYQNSLIKSKERGFNKLQAGRFIMSGSEFEVKDSSIFTPLFIDDSIDLENLESNSLYIEFQKRYQEYVEKFVESFHLNYFKKFDRQIILVDTLKALKSGYECFEDMVNSIESIISIYRYGKQNIFSRLFKNNRIDRVIFSATKCDHVANNQHNNYKSLLEMIIRKAKKEIAIKGVQTKSSIVSSVKSTQSVVKNYDNRRLSCLKGVVIGSSKESIVYPGEVPEYFPSKEHWEEELEYFDFPDFAPNIFFKDGKLENIRMDETLYYLIGDKI